MRDNETIRLYCMLAYRHKCTIILKKYVSIETINRIFSYIFGTLGCVDEMLTEQNLNIVLKNIVYRTSSQDT